MQFLSGRLSSLGAPIESPLFATYGEGSSFLAIPTKRNTVHHESKSSRQNQTYIDFKKVLLSHLIDALKNEGRDVDAIPQSLLPSDQQWSALNQLRIHAGAPERTDKGIEKLMQYYAQLCWLEEKFAFDTKIQAPFSWFEAFYVKKNVDTHCIQYEKASVIWNLGALYSQLGTIQCLWTLDGLKSAAIFFQKAAGAFIYLRDTLYPRIQLKLDQSADLSDATLTAVAELMLAQAAECFYLKAEFDNSSSAVTSQIAIQAADYYDIALKAAKVNNSLGRVRFPKIWNSNMEVKNLMLTAIAHFHCPNMTSADSAVGERQSRLSLAKQLCQKALDKCVERDSLLPHELRNNVQNSLEKISRAFDDLDKANFDDFHQTVLATHQLKPLKRPTQTLVGSVNVVMGQSNGSVIDGVYEGWINDVFDGVVGIMCISSGSQSGVPHPQNLPERSSLVSDFTRRVSVSIGNGSRFGSAQELVQSMRGKESRRVSVAASSNNKSIRMIKDFVIEIKQATDNQLKKLRNLTEQLECFKNIDVSILMNCLQSLKKITNASSEEKAVKLLSKYKELLKRNQQQKPGKVINKFWSIDQAIKNLENQRQSGSSQNEIQEVEDILKVWNTDEDVKSEYQFVHELKSLFQEFLITSEQEGLNDLFDQELTECTEQSSWSEEKIKAVIPCLDDDYKQRKKKLLKILEDYAYVLDSKFSNRKDRSFLNVVFDGLSSFIAVVDGAQNVLDNLETEIAFIDEFQRKWKCSESNQHESVQLNKLIENLGKDSDNIENVINEAKDDCLNLLQSSMKVYKQGDKFLSQFKNFTYTVQLDVNLAVQSIKEIVSVEKESENIITIFDEQLYKWSIWCSLSVKLDKSLSKFEKKLSQFKPVEIYDYDNGRKLHIQNVMESQNLVKLIDEQVQLEHQSIKQANKIVDASLDQILRATQNDSKRKVRGEMLRNISLTANAIHKMAQQIKETVKDDSEAMQEQDMLNLRNRLSEQMKKLHVEHREVVSGKSRDKIDQRRNSEQVVSKNSKSVQKRPSVAADLIVQASQQRQHDKNRNTRRQSVPRKLPQYDFHLDDSVHTNMYNDSDEDSVVSVLINQKMKGNMKPHRPGSRLSIEPLQNDLVHLGPSRKATYPHCQRRNSQSTYKIDRDMLESPQPVDFFMNRDISKRQSKSKDIGLQDGIASVSHYFAWNRDQGHAKQNQESFHDFARRGSLGGEPYIP